MVTRRKTQTYRPKRREPRVIKEPNRPFYLKEWRKFMGTKPSDLAAALGIERQSYHRLEKHWWTISLGEQDIICRTLGVKSSQLNFPPPKPGQEVVSVDGLIEEMPEPMQTAAILAVRGIAAGRR